MKIIKCVMSIVITLINVLLLTQNVDAESIRFRNIKDDSGLSQMTAEVILQDSNGYIWIGTADGLNKYNGYEYEVYRHDKWSEDSIANNYIVSLAEDGKGNLWIGTANGLSKMNLATNKITNYYSDEEGGLSHNNMGEILVTQDNKIVVATSDGINVYNEDTDTFKRILENKYDLISQYILSLVQDRNGDIWIGSDKGIQKINIKANKVETILDSREKINKIYSLTYDDRDNIWAGSIGEGAYKININSKEIDHYTYNEDKKSSIAGNYVRDIYKDKDENIWIASDGGLCKLNDNNTFTTYKHNTNDPNSIVNDNLYSIMQDESGLIWIGTYSGISIFNPNNNIIHYKNSKNDKISLNENVVHGIYEDDDGLLWIGTKSSGINIIDRKKEEVYILNKESSNNLFSDDAINDITGKGNYIYIATRNGLNIINKENKTIETYNKDNGLDNDDIKSLLIDSKDYLWIGTSKGISIINTNTDEIIELNNTLRKHKLETLFVKVIYEDSRGMYWVGCFIDNGLIKINPKDKSIKIYKHNKDDKSSISSNTIRTIKEDKNGNLLIGTSYGLNMLNVNSEKFKNLTTKDGLSNDVVYGVLIDEYEDIWLSTNYGISKYNIKNDVFYNLNIGDGLQSNEFNGNASYISKSGELIFGGINGVNIFKPEDIVGSNYVPSAEFDYFEVNGERVSNINNMKFKHNQNFINIGLFLPDYTNTKNIQYYYKLDEVRRDGKWRELKHNNINYSNLDDGEYTLKIKARNYNGLMSDEKVINFEIKPPFYKSDIAKLIYIIIGIIVLYIILNKVSYLDELVKLRTDQLNKQMITNQELYEKVINLERRKNNYFINLSHELRTPLNVIYSTEQLINEVNDRESGVESNKLREYMSLMGRNTQRLLKLINNLIDTSKIDNGNYTLKLKENDIVYIVEEAALSLKSYIEEKGVSLVIDPEIEEKTIECDSSEIERCIVNLVSNAAKFTHEGGEIIVSISELDNKTIITVEDNGIGIDQKYHEDIFNRFNQVIDPNTEIKRGSGLGLTITKQIIQLHNGEIYLESELGKGSKFTIII